MSKVHARLVKTSAIVAPEKSLTAAVQRYDTAARGNAAGSGGKGDETWQGQAWQYFDSVGELRFVCTWLGNALSQCSIHASRVDLLGNPTGSVEAGDGLELTPDDQLAIDTAGDIAGGPAGRAELLGRLATFLTVPGESFVAIIHRAPKGAAANAVIEGVSATMIEEWHVLSTDEVTTKSGKVELTLADGTKHEVDDELDVITRIWRPHPRRSAQATSPVQACLPALREIVRCGQVIEATTKSRLAGPGLLMLPNEISVPGNTAPTAERDNDAPGLPLPTPEQDVPLRPSYASATDIVRTLVDTASKAIEDPSSAATLVPIVMQAPAAAIASARLITFANDLAEVMLKMRETAVRRFAMSVDAPAEVLLGMGDVNHWGAWQIADGAIKLHVEPMLTLIVQALTETVYRPTLANLGVEDPDAYTLWFDTSMLASKPNRGQDARDAKGAGAISAKAYREALGFADSDAPFPILDEAGERLPDADLLEFLATMVMQAPASLLPLIGQYFGVEMAPQPTSVQDVEDLDSAGDEPAEPTEDESPADDAPAPPPDESVPATETEPAEVPG